MEKTNARVKSLKRQLDEAEEECARITAAKRKTQRDLDEQMEHNEVIHRELEQMKTRFRVVGGSVSEKLRCVFTTIITAPCLTYHCRTY